MNIPSLRTLSGAVLLLLATLLGAAPAQATLVRVHTTQGPMDLQLLDAEAPTTVANFLAYVRAGLYADVLFHRSSPGFVVQGGGFQWKPNTGAITPVATFAAIRNEFSTTRSNVRGTVAMAKTATGPDTATSQWFVNLANNARNLDNQNGGFTVFARVTAPGLAVADKIAALPVYNASWVASVGSAMTELPVLVRPVTASLARANVVIINQVTELPTGSDSDRVFNYLEASYPQFLAPSVGVAGSFEGYAYRWYSASNVYLATQGGTVWYLAPASGAGLIELGSVADWLAQAQASGY